jgi:hypothetical protein
LTVREPVNKENSVMLNIDQEVAALRQMPLDELRDKYADVFGEPTRSRHKEHLVRRIAWRLQANAEGNLSVRARLRAEELANDADLRVTAPRPPRTAPGAAARTKAFKFRLKPDERLPMPQCELTRMYKGRRIVVKVVTGGFEYEGQRFNSLTAVAKAVTGQHWNGYHFFRLPKKGGDQ